MPALLLLDQLLCPVAKWLCFNHFVSWCFQAEERKIKATLALFAELNTFSAIRW